MVMRYATGKSSHIFHVVQSDALLFDKYHILAEALEASAFLSHSCLINMFERVVQKRMQVYVREENVKEEGALKYVLSTVRS